MLRFMGYRQGALAPDTVPQHAEEHPAQGPKGKGHGKHGKGLEQCGTGIAAGEKLLGDGGGQKAIDGKIEPFDKITDGGGDNHFSQRFGADVLCGYACHVQPRPVISLR